MKKLIVSLITAMAAISSPLAAQTRQATPTSPDSVATVYHIKEITPENIIKIYEALGRKIDGKNVAVKVSTGERGNNNHLAASLIGPFVKSFNGTIVECNTAYDGSRNTTADHYKTAEEHGFTSFAKVKIMDEDGSVDLPVKSGKHLAKDIVGKDFLNYDFLVVLSHFKGHAMGGFGGALKNISIGIASAEGKAYIHSAGKTDDVATIWQNTAPQDDFLESMAEASEAILDHVGDKVIFINVANNLSVDCDCDANPSPVCMADLGIFASLDPVALDKACVDAVHNSDDHGKKHMIERIESRHGMVTLQHAEQLGLGTQNYKLVELK